MVFVASLVLTGVAFSQDRNPFWQEPVKSWLRIETQEQQKILFCGEVLASEARVRSSPEIKEDNIITCLDKEGKIVSCLNKGDVVKVYEVVEGDSVFFTRSVRGYTNNIWYRIREEEFIYSSLIQEKPRALCLS